MQNTTCATRHTDHCGDMTYLRIGERITLHGRDYEIVGFTPMSVKPTRVFLCDRETGEQVEVDADELLLESKARERSWDPPR
jgi:hypothetical protein